MGAAPEAAVARSIDEHDHGFDPDAFDDQAVQAAGQVPSRRFSRIDRRPAEPHEAEALSLSDAAEVHVVEGVSYADATPLAVFRSVFPAERFPDLPAHLAETGSVTAALRAEGVADYTRARTRLTAKAAKPMLALRLRISEGAPVLRSESVNVDAAGVPVEFGVTWFAGDRVTLTVDGQ